MYLIFNHDAEVERIRQSRALAARYARFLDTADPNDPDDQAALDKMLAEAKRQIFWHRWHHVWMVVLTAVLEAGSAIFCGVVAAIIAINVVVRTILFGREEP